MNLMEYRSYASVRSFNNSFLERLLEEDLCARVEDKSDFQEKRALQRPWSGTLTLESASDFLRRFWKIEQKWYADGNLRSFQGRGGVRFTCEVEIWETVPFQPWTEPKTLDNLELIPDRFFIKGAVPVQTSRHYEEEGRDNILHYRACRLTIRPELHQKQQDELLAFLGSPERVASVLGYFRQYYG